jgi:acyl-lipid omega-6 desaturase (Delta-12 desaturase)
MDLLSTPAATSPTTTIGSPYPQCAAAVRGTIHPTRRRKGTWLPLLILALNYVVFVGSFIGIVAVADWWLKVLLILINGHVIGTLFTVGHDACHDSFTRSRFLNGFIGRLSFMPSLTPFTPWRYTHNYLHSYTNCQDKDFVWRPLSLEQYRGLAWPKRLLERCYRTIPGLSLNWIVENWLKWHLFPKQGVRTQMTKWGTPTVDRLLIAGWLTLLLAAVGLLSWLFDEPGGLTVGETFLIYAGCCVIVPFLIFATLISYIDLLHHTHPEIQWFKHSSEPAFSDTQLDGTTRIVYPFPLGFLYHNIMEHTAHHVDPGIPMYHLRSAQSDLHHAHPEHIVVEFFSVRYLLRILRKCKLYDYEQRRWIGYDGKPTTVTEAVS